MSSERDMDKFWAKLDEVAEICHRSLQIRIDRLSKGISDMAPILWQHGAMARLEKGESLYNLVHNGYGTVSLGYAGIYECVKYMTGESHTKEGESRDFGLAVMQKLNDFTNRWKAEENVHYSIYGTPLESCTYKFAKAIQKDFDKVEGVNDRNYVTNSFHVPVFEEIDAFSKLAIESKFQTLSPGGVVNYVESPNMEKNIEAVIQVIQYIHNTIMYAEINSKSDYCQECEYSGEIKIEGDVAPNLYWKCPNCGNTNQDTMNIARRTCG